VTSVNVHPGDHVKKGQVLATLDAAAIESQIKAQEAQVSLIKSLYEKQQKLWAQNIGTEVQLLQAKANYTYQTQQLDALKAQRNMYRIVSPITGVVDNVGVKIGDAAGGQNQAGIRVVNLDKLKAEANLGENYLGKIHQGDRVNIVLPDIHDSIQSRLSYVASAVDPNSRAFIVQVRLGSNSKLHPNMSCIMKIAAYENRSALVVPVSVIQKTGKGEMVFIANGNKAKAVYVKTGRNSNGQVEIVSGLSAGDKVITAGFEDLDDGDPITNM
jgi:RND family efflux transporter MFP subunit